MRQSQMDRRQFLKVLGSGACAAAVSPMLRSGSDMVAYADIGNPGNTIVVINQEGGCSYNIAPVFNGVFEQRMGEVLPQNPLMIAGDQGLHPSLIGMKQIFDQGNLALYNCVGSVARTGSHAEDQALIQSGIETQRSSMAYGGTGGRVDSLLSGNPWAVVSMAGSALFIEGGPNARALNGLSGDTDPGSQLLRIKRTSLLNAGPLPQNAPQAFVRDQMYKFDQAFETLRQYSNRTLPVTFRQSNLGNALRDVARLIDSGLGVKLAYVTIGDHDTHSDERDRLTNRASELDAAITDFSNCMKALGRWNQVIIVTMTEFGRTFKNNQSGTDHGLAGVQFVAGGNVAGGIKTPAPTAAECNEGNYIKAVHVSWNAALKQATRWLGVDQNVVFPTGLVEGPSYLSV